MKKSLSIFCPIALLAANSCAMAALFTVFSLVEKAEKTDPCLALWLVCLAMCSMGLEFFLRRERSERAVIKFCGAFFLSQLVLAFVIYGAFSGVVGMLAAFATWLYSYYSCFELSTGKITAERVSKSFDLCVLVLVFLIFFCSIKGLPMTTVLPLGISTFLCLMALVLVRGGEKRKLRSLVLSGGIVLGFGAAAAGFVAVATGGVQKLVSAILTLVYAALGFVYRCVHRLFLFLISLWPQKEYGQLPAPELQSMDLSDIPDVPINLFDPQKLMIALLILGLAIALAIVVFHMLRGKRSFGRAHYGGEQNLSRQRSSIVAALKKAFCRLMDALRFKLLCITQRNTAPGLFVQIVKRSRHELHGRGESESCREFLLRAREVYPHAPVELERLADILDSLHFGAGDNISSAEIARLRKHIFSVEN